MDHLVEALAAAVESWDRAGHPRPVAALVSGSGLAVELDFPSLGRWPMAELLPWPVHGIAGHPMQVELLLPRPDSPLLYLRGRLHCYQGYTPAQAVFTVRLAALLGAHTLLLTNAAGGIDSGFAAGDLVQITDHLNLTGLNPLAGAPPEDWGPRFPDMANAYDRGLRGQIAGVRRAASASPCARGSTPASPGRATRRRPRCACSAAWAASWSACRRCSK